MSATYKVGGECDAWCTKCKRDTLHNIIALAAGNAVPARVECRSCHGTHNYAAPRSAPRAKAARAAASASREPKAATSTKSATPKGAKVSSAASAKLAATARDLEQRWEVLVAANASVTERPYSAKAVFGPGDAILHGQFGLGFVLASAGEQRIRVLFRDSERTLVTGYGVA
jgi:hypothetical protein